MKKTLLLITILLITISSYGQNSIIKGEITRTAGHDSVMVWLIKYDSTTQILTAVDSQLLDLPIYPKTPYRFENVAAGTYRIKAALNRTYIVPSTGINAEVPTYYDTTLFWNRAKTVQVNGQDSLTVSFALLKGLYQNGTGFIGGSVLQGANKGTSGGIKDMPVFLLDGNGKLLLYARTDANGKYSFDKLPNGNYIVSPEQLNYTITQRNVSISSSTPSVNNITFERSLKNKTIAPKTTSTATINLNKDWKIYPNPARETLTIFNTQQVEDAVHITMTDITGKIVHQNTSNKGRLITIDTKELVSGIYILSINSENIHLTKKVIIQ